VYFTRVFRTYLGTFWRTILTSIITWYNYIFTYLSKYEIERIIEQPDARFLDTLLIFGEFEAIFG
jgi:hypothetical protein